jgi:hypothetical protein
VSFSLPSLCACDGRGSESVSELRNVLRTKAHGTIVVDRVAVNPAGPYWAHGWFSLFIVRGLQLKLPSRKNLTKVESTPVASQSSTKHTARDLLGVVNYDHSKITEQGPYEVFGSVSGMKADCMIATNLRVARLKLDYLHSDFYRNGGGTVCFVIFTIAKYGRICTLIGRNIAYRGISFVLPIFIIIIWDESYCLALINTFRPERK